MTATHSPQLARLHRSAVLIINVQSRQGRRLLAKSLDLLHQEGIHLKAVHPVHDPAELRDLVVSEIENRRRLIVVGGGDGTLRSVVGAFAYRPATLAVLPMGTGNSFAKSLGVESLQEAVRAIAHGRPKRVPLGRVNDHYFANSVSIGMTTRMARDTNVALKHYLGRFAYAINALWHILTYPPFWAHMKIDNEERRFRLHQLIVGNGRFYGVTPVLPGARLTRDSLAIFLIEAGNRFQLLVAWVHFLLSRKRQLPETHRMYATEVWVTTDRRTTIEIDGEIFTKTPAYIRLARKALRVLAAR